MVHIYKGMEFVASLNYSPEEFKPEWFDGWENNMNIYPDKFQNPILEKGKLREMKREELVERNIEIELKEGEVIKGKKLITLKKPSEYHTWNGSNWEVDLQDVKNKKREELKKIREEKIEENIDVNGNIFQVRKGDLDNFYNLKIAMDLDSKIKTQKVSWILADNKIKQFNYVDLMGVLSQYMLRKQNLFLKFGELVYKLESCKTVEEIKNIEWE